MPHEDGNAYSPVVATVSLGASIVLDIYSKRDSSTIDATPNGTTTGREDESDTKREDEIVEGELDPSKSASVENIQNHWRIYQEPRSLLLTTGTAYASLLHGISPITRDEELGPDTVANWELLGDRDKIERAGGVNEREVRVSLTYRDVLKVSKVGLSVLGRR